MISKYQINHNLGRANCALVHILKLHDERDKQYSANKVRLYSTNAFMELRRSSPFILIQ
jgi:hypothetical protein